jgi:hypothetical protein
MILAAALFALSTHSGIQLIADRDHASTPTNTCNAEAAAIDAGAEVRQWIAEGRIVVLDPAWSKQNGGDPAHQITPEEKAQLESQAIGYEADANRYRIMCGA